MRDMRLGSKRVLMIQGSLAEDHSPLRWVQREAVHQRVLRYR